MKGLSLLIETAESLPFLGFYSEPQAYCVIKYNTERKVSPISKIGRNPFWMFETELNLLEKSKDTPVEVYIYNSNSNAEDELLGWTHILPSTMNFITLTKTKYQLHNLEGHRISSFVNISSKRLPHVETGYFTEKECIKVEILNYVQMEKENFSTVNIESTIVKFQYENFVTGLKYGERNHITFPYSKLDEVLISLEGIENAKNEESLSMSFNLKNLKEKEPQFFKFRFFDPIFPSFNYVACLVFTVIPSSNLPILYPFMQINVKSEIKDNFFLRVNSPLEIVVIKSVGNGKSFKLPNTHSLVTFDYFDVQKIDEKDLSKENDEESIIKTLAKYQPIQSTEIQINELEWSSSQRSEFVWAIKKEKIIKNLTIEFQASKELKSVIKQIYPTNFVGSSIYEKTIKLKQIKISSCYFYEVLPLESELHVYHVDFYGTVANFGSFTLKPNQSEYIVDSRACLLNEGGELVFVCFELNLKDDDLKGKIISSKEFLENHMIFKVKTEKDKEIMSGKIIYNQFFISFAKKVSLIKLCKKFEQAVHSDALSIQPKLQLWIPFKKGLLELINCQLSGFESFNSIELTIGSDTKNFESFGEEFLCQKESFFYVDNEKIALKIITNGVETSVHYAFAEIFGNPENTANEVKTYLREIDIKGGKLKIWFKFTPLDNKFQEKEVSLLGDERLSQCSPTIPVKLGPKKITILKKEGKDILGINPENEHSLKIRMTHQSGHYESSVEKSATGSFYFDPRLNHLLTRTSTNDEGKYIFISAQISETKSKSTENQNLILSDENEKEQKFYNSAIDITKILGKGLIEVKFFDNKTGKLEIIGEFEVFSENLLKKEISIMKIQEKNLSLSLKMTSLKLTNNLKYLSNFTGYQESLYKSIYSYFVMFVVNGSYYSLVSLDSNSKFCEKSSLPIKEIINNQILFIDNRSIVEIKIISKLKKVEAKELHEKVHELWSQCFKINSDNLKQKLMELEVEIIGEKTLTFAGLYSKQENKQFSIETEALFYGNREMQSKYSNEQISIMRNSSNFTLTFDIIDNQNQKEQIIEIQQNVKYTELSVLKQFLGLLKIKSIIPKKIDSSREIFNGDLMILVNSEEINYLPLNNLIESSTTVLIERSEFKLSLLSKKNSEIIDKKVSLPSYLKTNQIWYHNIDIGNFIVSFSIECFSNGLTTFSQGRLILKELSILNGKVEKIKVNYPIQENSEISYFSCEKNITGGKFIFNSEIEIQRKMKKILKEALFFEIFIGSEKKQIMAKIYLSQLSISTKINQDNSGTIKMSFEDQINIFENQNMINLSISGEYQVERSDSLKESKKMIRYSLLSEKETEIEVPENILNREISANPSRNKGENMIPSRENGVKLELELPEKFLLYLEETNRQFFLENINIEGINKDEVFTLIKSKEKSNIFYKYLDQLIIVKSLGFLEINEGVKKNQTKFKIEMLNINQVKNSTKPVYKFILDENPEFVLTVTQSFYQIPKAVKIDKGLQYKNEESLIFEISVHRLLSMSIFDRLLRKTQSNEKELSSQEKKLLCLKNSPNDEILTNKFCLYFKHGRQEQILFGIDLEGNFTNPESFSSSIKFGYDAEDDEIDIFLCAENFWNKTQYNEKSGEKTGFFVEKYSYDEIERKWISLMPLNHYLIKISEIKKNNINFSSILRPYQYTLTQTSLAKELYQRFETKNVSFFGSFTFQQGYWGNLIVKVNKIGPISFKSELLSSKNKNKIPKILCYMKISIEHMKVTLKESNTEALEWIQGEFLSFKTFLSHLFLESKEESEKKYLKFEMFMISERSSTEKVFEKRYPLEDILSHELKNEKVNISILESDTNQITEHFQMEVLFSNTKEFQNETVFSSDTFEQKNLIETSHSNVQEIDMISYKDKSFIDILKMILSTNDRTHFQGYLNEVKESFIYEEITFDRVESPLGILIILLPYLKTNARFCFVNILEMLEVAIIKNQFVIKYLDQIITEKNEPFLYSLFKSIMEKDNKEEFLEKNANPEFLKVVDNLISTLNEIKGKETKISLEKFFTKNNIQKLTSCIETHSILFNSKNISENYLSEDVMKLMLSIISQIIEHSENFLQTISKNIDQWIEFTAYKSLPILAKMIEVVDKINLGHQTLISQQTSENLMRIFLDRKIEIDIIYQYWLRLSDGSKSECFEEILSKYYLLENDKEGDQEYNSEVEEIKRTKILRLFYAYLAKSLKRVAKSQKASRISEVGEKESEKGSIISKAMYAIDLNPNLVEKYQSLFEITLFKNGNVLLLNAIVELIITWKELRALKEERVAFFLSSSKKYLEKDKKKVVKPGTQANFNKILVKEKSDINDEESQNLILNEKNKKSILENFIKALTGKERPNQVLKQKNEGDKNSEGFSKYSKYLITR